MTRNIQLVIKLFFAVPDKIPGIQTELKPAHKEDI